mmetsp:Transcript_78907/g.235177  ORF Transcript_78907/g.235177 Transcript_78907/m.235177 type:complete len:414 (-) Transcript_78907:133-1374(-)
MRTTRMKSSLLISGPLRFFLGFGSFLLSSPFPASPESSLLPPSSPALSSPSLLSSLPTGFSASAPFSALASTSLAGPRPASLPAELEDELGKSASSFSDSISHMCSSRNLRISSFVSSPLSSPEMTWNKSSALPPFASMQTLSLAATSIRKASYSANAWCHAHCLTFATLPCALTSRRFCMSALLLREVSSCRIASTSSGISDTVLVMLWTRSWTDLSWAFTASIDASTLPAFSLSSSILSLLLSFDNDSASSSAPCIFGSNSPNAVRTSELVVASSVFFSSTRNLRFSASILSCFSCSKRFTRRSLPRSSSRAIPMAVFSSWKSAKSRPLRPYRNSCLHILSKLSLGSSKPNASREHTHTSSRFSKPSPSLSNLLNKAAFFSCLFDEAIFLAMRSLCSFALDKASVACRVAC